MRRRYTCPPAARWRRYGPPTRRCARTCHRWCHTSWSDPPSPGTPGWDHAATRRPGSPARPAHPSTVVSAYVTPFDRVNPPDRGSKRESSMYPAGIRAATLTVPSTSDTEPAASSRGVSPCSPSRYTNELGACAEYRTSDSLKPVAVAANTRSTPGETLGYLSVSPDTVGVTGAAPTNEYDTARPASNRNVARIGCVGRGAEVDAGRAGALPVAAVAAKDERPVDRLPTAVGRAVVHRILEHLAGERAIGIGVHVGLGRRRAGDADTGIRVEAAVVGQLARRPRGHHRPRPRVGRHRADSGVRCPSRAAARPRLPGRHVVLPVCGRTRRRLHRQPDERRCPVLRQRPGTASQPLPQPRQREAATRR